MADDEELKKLLLSYGLENLLNSLYGLCEEQSKNCIKLNRKYWTRAAKIVEMAYEKERKNR
jgi:hypothetical protein